MFKDRDLLRMDLQKIARAVLPGRALAQLRRAVWELERRRVASLAPLTEEDFTRISSSTISVWRPEVWFMYTAAWTDLTSRFRSTASCF